MKKLLALSLFLVLGLAISSQALAVKVGTFGIPVDDVAPLEVDDSGNLTVTADLTQTGDLDVTGEITSAGNLTVTGEIYTDGTIYESGLNLDGYLKIGAATIDPCGTLRTGSIFMNENTGAPCFCNSSGVDVTIYDETLACY